MQTDFILKLLIYEPGHEKMCLMSYANNKGADQPVHPRSLISAFVVRCLDSIIPLDSIAEISRLYLASVAAQAGLCMVGNSRRHVLSCRGSYILVKRVATAKNLPIPGILNLKCTKGK